MEKHITDQEYQLLKNKIQVAESYVHDLQTIHLNLCGQRHHISGPMPDRARKEALGRVVIDLVEMA